MYVTYELYFYIEFSPQNIHIFLHHRPVSSDQINRVYENLDLFF
jgi:hypothetical protein